ncbi:hypothetical protein LSH36_316g05006 [Paralvinella palmiformis]|uniref:Uncharacterized protein n=1 Tax=Paralvinella palmiformis TaxID=53620 RepID=A0AAD9JH45_9ANNE|nr:hypothetical protein LSH36_316g05006 [Paralvinella palmiformis]
MASQSLEGRQPDKGCFASLSKHYNSVCSGFMATSKFQVSFACLFTEAWERSMTLMNVRVGFRMTGIYPFSQAAWRCLWPSVYRLLLNWMFLVLKVFLSSFLWLQPLFDYFINYDKVYVD